MYPVYRDVHPDKCPIEIYDEDGDIALRADIDARMVAALDRVAKKERVKVHDLLCGFVIDHLEKLRWGNPELSDEPFAF